MRFHARYLFGALAVPALIVGVAAVVLEGPWSPLALDRANARYVAGDLAGAAAAYAEVAGGWHTPGTRAEAAARAALIAVQSREPTQAANWLRVAADLEPEAARRGALRMQLGTLYLQDLRDPLRAAETFAPADVDRGDGHAILAAARAWERAGRSEQALESYQRAVAALGEGDAREEAGIGLDRVGASLSGVADAEAP